MILTPHRNIFKLTAKDLLTKSIWMDLLDTLALAFYAARTAPRLQSLIQWSVLLYIFCPLIARTHGGEAIFSVFLSKLGHTLFIFSYNYMCLDSCIVNKHTTRDCFVLSNTTWIIINGCFGSFFFVNFGDQKWKID